MQNKEEILEAVAKVIDTAQNLNKAQGDLTTLLQQEGELNDMVFDIINDLVDGEYDDPEEAAEALTKAMKDGE